MPEITISVSAALDDGRQLGSLVQSNAIFRLTSATHWGIFIFRNIAVPAGAVISSAVLHGYVTSDYTDAVNAGNVYCEDSISPATIVITSNNISARSRTTSYAVLNTTLTINSWNNIIDAASPVQEVINKPTWVSGSDIALIFDVNETCDFGWRACDYDSGSFAPELVINFTESVSSLSGADLQLPGYGRFTYQ